MKITATLLALSIGFSVQAASAGVECITQTNRFDFITVDRDGGEETLTIHHLSESKERFLVTHNNNGSVIAIKDNDLDGGASRRGVALIYEANGRGGLALDGDIIEVTCQKK